ncbi:MAG TPA: NAD-dependent epimerase/dehydratase family protein [Ornithinibacter sp.]|nr:NAD-dependent epimerase/dehydratase family protein [Ornithinibacter sp.]
MDQVRDDARRHTADAPARQRVVVTGGAGFLGSHLCSALVARGAQVLALDNFLTGPPNNVANLMHDPLFRLVRCEVTDFVHVGGRVDLVLHFGSPGSPIDYLLMPVETLSVGSMGAWHPLGLAREKRARFVLASTSEVYGDPQVPPQPESYWGHVNPIGPRGVYEEGKRFGEALTTAASPPAQCTSRSQRSTSSSSARKSGPSSNPAARHRWASTRRARVGLSSSWLSGPQPCRFTAVSGAPASSAWSVGQSLSALGWSAHSQVIFNPTVLPDSPSRPVLEGRRCVRSTAVFHRRNRRGAWA